MTKVSENLMNKKQKIINMVPGILVYKGQVESPFHISVYSYGPDAYKKSTFTAADRQLMEGLSNQQVHWINVVGYSHVDQIRNIGDLFNIDTLLLEQILNISKSSSQIITDSYIFNDLQMLRLMDDKIISENINVYMKDNLVFTFQERSGDVFDSIRHRIESGEGYVRSRSAYYLYFCMMDALVDYYMYAVDGIKQMVEDLEMAFDDEARIPVGIIHDIRSRIRTVRFSARPLEVMVQELISKRQTRIESEDKYFRSLVNQIKTVIGEVMTQKEIIDGLYQNYMMLSSDKMNRIMTTLTIFSAIFIPLSFMAGIFGMNFEFMPGLDNPDGFFYFIIGAVLTGIGMLGFFRIKKWL